MARLISLTEWLRGRHRRRAWPRLLVIAFLACAVPLPAADFSLFKPKPKPAATAPDATAARLKEIDQAVKGFADRYVTYLVDACDRVAKDNPDREARTQALRLKLFHSTSAYGIASSPNPLGQLLDLAVVVTLGKINWVDEGRAKKVFGAERAQPVIEIFNNSYTEVWDMAGRFLTPDEISETKKLIHQWRARHKDLALLAYVRFDDFSKARAGLEQQNPVVKGLFSQITEAGRTIESATNFGERTLYLAERLPRLLQWQTERTVQAVLENPDVQQGLASFTQFSQTSAELSQTFAQLSKTIAEEAGKFDARQAEVQKILEQVNQVTVNGKALVMEARQTSESLTQTFRAFDALMHTINPPLAPGATPKPEGRPFDITEYGPVFDKATVTAREARLLMEASLQLETAPAFNRRIADIEDFTQRRMDHITIRVAQLIIFFFVMLFLTRWLCARCFGPKSRKE